MNNIYIPPVVKNLLIINVLFFLVTYVFNGLLSDQVVNTLPVYYFGSPFFKGWQPVTYMFMHGGWAHIFFNMFALYSFGSLLESRWGAKRFLIFYLVTGLGALGLQWAVQAFEMYQATGQLVPSLDLLRTLDIADAQKAVEIYQSPMVGASGAIFGLLIAFGMLYPNAELYVFLIPVPVKAKYLVPVYILIELSLGLARVQGDSVAHFAHLGGALIGFILIKLWKDNNNFYNYYE
ncbi:rhomboid family intramembrane serine protease [Pedobacter yulinensis]|uniref:rhomboid family intramembrane serine protease n=1 Tax=Pedobacter yulinensis TaxID=2126353 RepID=UPI0019551249|nr:rhomboid family intramembrane serine protease [Pedobacter yulinensis]